MPTARRAQVLETRRLTPQMIRVVFGGGELSGFGAGECTDHYVKLRIAERTRTYTVREWDGERLTIDFVVHGDEGVAGPWAAAAQPGDELELRGPGGAYTPDPDADWHLMIGDSAVIPAIAASLARIPAGVPVHVLVSVDGPEEEQPLSTPGDLHLRWLPGDAALVAAVADLDFPPGRVHAFVHGEASAVRELRRHLLVDRGLPREALSVSGYWKRTRTEEGWREDKAEWNRLVEEDAAEDAAA